MSLSLPGTEPREPRERLAVEVRRVADRLRSLPPSRLTPAVADQAHAVSQHLADAASALERRPPRPVPVLQVHALGDQVEVTGADLLALLPAGRADRSQQAEDALAAALEAVVALRRAL